MPFSKALNPHCKCSVANSTKQRLPSESGRKQWQLHRFSVWVAVEKSILPWITKCQEEAIMSSSQKKTYLLWGHGGFPEEVGGCRSPGCSTCSSAWANSCDQANSAPCWDNLGKTFPAQPQWAQRPAQPVACTVAVLGKVKLNLTLMTQNFLVTIIGAHTSCVKITLQTQIELKQDTGKVFYLWLTKSDRWFLVQNQTMQLCEFKTIPLN